MNLPFRSLVLAAGLLGLGSAAAQAAEYSVLSRFLIGGDTSGCDYLRVDADARRVYLSHEKRFEVIDADSGKKIGEIGPASRAHGIALSPETNHGFATSGLDDVVIMFDMKTLAVIKQIKSTGSGPDAIEYDPESKKVYAANHGSGGITVIDPATGDVAGTIAIEGKLEGVAFDGRGQGYVNIEDKSAVAVFDTHTLKAKAQWSAAPGEGGTGLGIDPVHHRIFSSTANNNMVVLDSDSGKVVATAKCGDDPDGLVFDPKTSRIFTSNADGTMTVIQQDSADKYSTIQTVTTEPGCKTLALDSKTGRIFTAAPKYGPKPAPVKGGPKPRAPVLPGTFEAVVVGTK